MLAAVRCDAAFATTPMVLCRLHRLGVCLELFFPDTRFKNEVCFLVLPLHDVRRLGVLWWTEG